MDRREFFRTLGATGGAAAVAGCGKATEHLLPHVVPNEQIVPGIPSFFATVCRECPAGCGVLARNNNGRVTKLEGNPEHPVSQGALCIRGQAALQGLYHPDRIGGPRLQGKPVSWDDAQKAFVEKLSGARKSGRGKVAVVSRLENGSLGRFLDRWGEALGTRPRLAYEPFAYEAIRAADRASFGLDVIPYYAFEDATVVLSFGADFIETWLSNVEYSRNFGRMHSLRGGRAGTFIHVEPRQSLTAASADEWVRNAPGTEGVLALAILKAMLDENLADKTLTAAARDVDVTKAAAETGVPEETIRHIAQAFAKGKPSLAIGGGVAATGTNATQTMIAINLLNIAAGNIGKTVRFGPDSAYARAARYADFAALSQAMGNGEIEVLLLANGVNPVFTAPAGLKFGDAIKRVPFVVSFSNVPDETTSAAHLVLPDTHWLESWGDYSPREGVLGLMQPTMSPVRDSRPMGEVLIAVGRAVLGSEEGKGPLPWTGFEEYVKKAWEPALKSAGLERALQQGGIWKDTAVATAALARGVTAEAAPAKLDGDPNGFALLPYPSLRWFDGRGASRSWLQEAPDPMTQVAWDAWVEVPAEVATRLQVAPGDVLRVTSPHGAIELPAYVSASLHPKAVAIPIGQHYAPYQLGRYVAAASAMNPMALLGSTVDAASGALAFFSVRVTLEKTGTRRPLAVLQATHDQDHREIAQEVELAAARELDMRGKPPAHASHPSMYPDQIYPNHRWGMAIDLDSCIGCAACMIACQAENNVPVVGKAQAAYGRQVHWIRLERWAEGAPSHPTNIFLPMLCQHCEVAPCEPVCPVFAAYRTDEGLNGQVYNRCVGTRYCGNNCPYHVRRFNWYQWEWPEPLDVQLNPDVTVRQLGVMEKCTMCLQRIIAGKDRARDAASAPGRAAGERPRVRDGDIQTACQQTCPTQAITFGDLKDGNSQVSKLSASPRGYHVLEELGTRPSITYLRKVVRGHGKPPEKGHGKA
jgi:anaerobic selenocysteine-containing dehydrogenase/Fe-S-cluster-containing dehydrogenase component